MDIFLISVQTCGYSLEVAHWGASYEYARFPAEVKKYFPDMPFIWSYYYFKAGFVMMEIVVYKIIAQDKREYPHNIFLILRCL